MTPLIRTEDFEDAEKEEASRLSTGKALRVFAGDPRILGKSWWLPVINMIPPFSFPIMLGWKVNLIRRLGLGQEHPLPNSKDVDRFFVSGIAVYCAIIAYYVPLVILIFVCNLQLGSNVSGLFRAIWNQLFSNNPTANLWLTLWPLIARLLADLLLPAFYSLGLWPIFQAGIIRYALEKRWRALYEFWSNLYLVYKHAGDFFFSMFVIYVSRILLFAIIAPLLAATFLGAFALPWLILPFYFAFSGHLLGQIAEAVHRPKLALQATVTYAMPPLPG